MKTLMIVTYHPNEWREHAHVISWLRSEGYEINTMNFAEVIREQDSSLSAIVQEYGLVLLYYSCIQPTMVNQDSVQEIACDYHRIEGVCSAHGVNVLGVYEHDCKPIPELSEIIQWREWNNETIHTIWGWWRNAEKHIVNQHVFKPP